MSKIKLELLSPAKDLETGIAAIDCGADAVYIGSPQFGARAAAGNSLEDIRKLVEYAHKYWAKVYVTVNTVIYNDELEEVQRLIRELYEIKVDAVIFQDMALLEMDLPPVQLYASTQTHNYEIERIKFLDRLGIKRIILARELTIEEIKQIKREVNAELEFFVHGALCVSLSGQCYMSHELTGRSANRGECAQNCRLPYSLVDANGTVMVENKHLLSLRDLNLSEYLNELVDAGITSFKIEGRLKDVGYVKNITAFYRQKIDDIIRNNSNWIRASSGYSKIPFEPDPERTFNRGYTSYYLNDRTDHVSSPDTPKSTGKYLGKVTEVNNKGFVIGTTERISNGDGLCFYDIKGELAGMYVNRIEGRTVYTKELIGIRPGMKIYRNYDHSFEKLLSRECKRKIRTNIIIDEMEKGLKVTARDEDDISTTEIFDLKKEIASNPEKANDAVRKQFAKSGDTIFEIESVNLNFIKPLFIQLSSINEMRRRILQRLEFERLEKHKNENGKQNTEPGTKNSDNKFPQDNLDYKFNVTNKLAEKFYKVHGVLNYEPGFELQNNHTGKTVMTCKYCIKDEMGLCPFDTDKKVEEPLYLVNESRKYRLHFNCRDCLMEILVD
ncbi:MAG TPA: U32 family peptidase [Melioribacteraceae bacterium]|nr:U32 family peptidase [Melioribacteraceae bacterium]